MDSHTTTSAAITGDHTSVITRTLQTHNQDPSSKIQAAKEIRRLTKTSHRFRRHFSDAIPPLVSMLRYPSVESNAAALLALVNLAVQDETNKISIVDAGALESIVTFLHMGNINMQEHATASLATLSASPVTRSAIGASGAIPFLVEVLHQGTPQAKVDAVMALFNLSSEKHNLNLILQSQPVPYLVNILKSSKKSSKVSERCTGLLESLIGFEEGRVSLTSEEGGVLAVVEVLERGSPQNREHAVGALLTMCQSDRCRYREPILKEGVIPGLLELTVQGTPNSQTKAHTLLRLLRESPYPRSELEPDTLENIVCDIISQIEGEEQSGNAKQMLADMVQVSMEQSLRHLQQRALVCTTSEVSLK
ncbi:putative armadillo-like helical protein [Helianthus annuus]|uniref:Armadillo-like helical protein n=1 Tax=Helianthus annuus TaxID=4232 RepID=A0A251TWU6_HELAN|nr:U-box domain-containing protein 4 [Helianthus annuus]KAF5791478.1 putative armadillo-like helical protein [Helianthus annuus]KAJ0526539.1 putative armadillo-like helical protein [Helianthus annuus]KAJ0534996.1 putative armadillo-like helical protein [Helianthus annuus]KAJ0542932.1 putative armadillo-like helical protein [Helianthus annuus]KAJ0707987.1 putative armadillo-like helical protein [Helianthus annuus]